MKGELGISCVVTWSAAAIVVREVVVWLSVIGHKHTPYQCVGTMIFGVWESINRAKRLLYTPLTDAAAR